MKNPGFQSYFLVFSPEKRSENSEYRPLSSGPHWIPTFAGMTEYCLYRGSTRPKASFQSTLIWSEPFVL